MDPELWIRAFYLVATVLVLALAWTPALRTRFLNYGPRRLPGRSDGDSRSSTRDDARQQRTSTPLLDRLGSVNVPHGWFWHFYALSVALSAFWAARFLTLPSLWTGSATSGYWPYKDGLDRSGMNMHQVILLWALLSVQGGRRLYECLAFMKPSRSTMWIGHYVLGLLYYAAMSVAVWVEGRGLQPAFPRPFRPRVIGGSNDNGGDANVRCFWMDVAAIHQARFSWDSATISAPSLRTLLCLPLFLFASGLQYDCHQHLSTLKKYTVPTHPWFRRLVCPHYTAECVIYLALSIMAAPKGSLVNKTMLTVLIFVTTNLAITADKARAFYIQKFGHDSVSSKWRIIPFVF